MTVRVLIVDDQAPFRDAARTVVELTDGFEAVGEAATGILAVPIGFRTIKGRSEPVEVCRITG